MPYLFTVSKEKERRKKLTFREFVINRISKFLQIFLNKSKNIENMKSPKVLIIMATNTIVGLLLFQLLTLPPMDQDYQDCLQQISSLTGMEQEEEMLKHYPNLKTAKANCETVKLLHTEIEAISGGPAPNVTKEQEHLIRQKQNKVKALKAQNERIFKQIESKIGSIP